MAGKVRAEDSFSGLASAAGLLKRTRRSGWYRKGWVQEKNSESVADHSFRAALLGCALAEGMGLDSGKVARMCLLHDLAESEIGDLMPEEKESELQHRRTEDRVVRSILNPLPKKASERLLLDWKELLAKETPEARLSWHVDKLEMGLQALDYAQDINGESRRRQFLSEFSPARELPVELQRILKSYARRKRKRRRNEKKS